MRQAAMAPDPKPDPTANPGPDPAPDPTPAPPADDNEPTWARSLRQVIEGLPGKLQAVVSDDQISQIAEGVHGLFERSGAFLKGEEPPAEDEPADPAGGEGPPKPGKDDAPAKQTWAERTFGKY